VGKFDYHAIVVGSGFGGSVVAHRLAAEANAPWSVCLLERGKSHAPGEFPRTPYEVKRSFWDPKGQLYGLFDVWSFSGLAAVVASGLGGGSLIYANVLEPPPDGWLNYTDEDGGEHPWPVAASDLAGHFAAVEAMLRPQPYPDAGPFARTPKSKAFRKAANRAGLQTGPARLGVQFGDDHGTYGRRLPFGRPQENRHDVQRFTCDMVGECDIGCNLGAKHTLDLTYLSAPENGDNLEIRTLSEVRALRPIDGGFEVQVRDYSRGADHPPRSKTLTCARLVLAAGTLGTVLLLLRNRLALRGLSQRVGLQFCGNGDYLAFAAGCEPGSNGSKPIEPSRGPVITTSARARDRSDGGDGPGFHLQDGGYPGWASWLSEVTGVRRDVKRVGLHARALVQGHLRGDPEDNLSAELSGMLGDDAAHLMPILSLGREVPAGRLRLRGRRLDLDWRKDESAALYERAEAAARRMTTALGGRYADPLRVLRPITVHPLGGCAMSADPMHGVVDVNGEVHGVPNLSIADGSVLPGPVGINPALTIAALADRHATWLIEKGRPER
jgi:cholesterol oxidase